MYNNRYILKGELFMKQAIDFDFDEAINNYNDKYNFIKQSKYDIKHNWLLYIHSILLPIHRHV